MAPAFRHETIAPNLHRFLFPSASRPGVEHELLLDLDQEGDERFSCLCEAALHDRPCKHKRAVQKWLSGRAQRSKA
jgi:hypothetical protein